MADVRYPRLASFKTADALRRHLRQSGIALELDDALPAAERLALAQPIDVGPVRVGNRFCILPMEGWDGTSGGAPSELTRRRWRHFGISGAKLIWGGEAVAVRQDGRANPNQLLLTRDTQGEIAALRDVLVAAHRGRFGSNADGDLFIGLQLTHSGRFARPHATDRPEPLAAYAHPWLDRRFPGGLQMVPDEDLDRLVDQFVEAARLAWDAGFAFVDVKACHGYLGHELLSARDREGRYGGSLENRTRFLRSIVAGIRDTSPRLAIGVRLSVFDTVPFRKNARGVGEGEAPASSYRWAFGLFDSDKGSMDEALAARQEWKALDSQVKAAQHDKKASQDLRLPTLRVDGNWAYEGTRLNNGIPVYNYQASLDVPIFTGGRTHAEIVRADLQLKVLDQQKSDLRNQISLDVKTALLNLKSARNQVEVATLGIQLAKEEVDQARDRFKAGVANNIEVIQAQDALARANDNQIAALYRFNQARADYARSIGQMEKVYAK